MTSQHLLCVQEATTSPARVYSSRHGPVQAGSEVSCRKALLSLLTELISIQVSEMGMMVTEFDAVGLVVLKMRFGPLFNCQRIRFIFPIYVFATA